MLSYFQQLWQIEVLTVPTHSIVYCCATMSEASAVILAGGGEVEALQEKLKELCKRRGLTQEELAQQIGVSLRTVARWETKGGKPFRILRTRLKKLFEEVGIDAG